MTVKMTVKIQAQIVLPKVLTAIVTPFDLTEKVDFNSMIELIRYQLLNECGVVLFGTTGECPTVTNDERDTIYEKVKQVFESNLNEKFVIGVGGNNTQECCELIHQAEQYGFTNFMLTTPYYNKPTQLGLEKHFTTIMQKYSDYNFILYNVPGRCGVNLLPETVKNICNQNLNAYAIKEASGDLNQFIQIKKLIPELKLYCGDDGLIVPAMSIGSYGLISVVSNAYPASVNNIIKECNLNNYSVAFHQYLKINDIIKLLFSETSPSPIKFLLQHMGLISTDVVRLPLVPMQNQDVKDKIKIFVETHNN